MHDNTCSLFHKRYHPKKSHSENKYHVTLNNIFTLVLCSQAFPTKIVGVGSFHAPNLSTLSLRAYIVSLNTHIVEW